MFNQNSQRWDHRQLEAFVNVKNFKFGNLFELVV